MLADGLVFPLNAAFVFLLIKRMYGLSCCDWAYGKALFKQKRLAKHLDEMTSPSAISGIRCAFGNVQKCTHLYTLHNLHFPSLHCSRFFEFEYDYCHNGKGNEAE